MRRTASYFTDYTGHEHPKATQRCQNLKAVTAGQYGAFPQN